MECQLIWARRIKINRVYFLWNDMGLCLHDNGNVLERENYEFAKGDIYPVLNSQSKTLIINIQWTTPWLMKPIFPNTNAFTVSLKLSVCKLTKILIFIYKYIYNWHSSNLLVVYKVTQILRKTDKLNSVKFSVIISLLYVISLTEQLVY